MSKAEIYVVVEGQTEQTFVREVLAPYIAQKGIYLHSALIGKPGHKGGNIRFDRAKTDIGHFLKQRKDTYISTMFDFYRIDVNWPGREEVYRQIKKGQTLAAHQKADILETATMQEVLKVFPGNNVDRRFIPYIEMHEFEALLFSDAEILAEKAEIDAARVKSIIETYNNPEEINDDPGSSPSNRLMALKEGYRKVAVGKTVSEAIGIPMMRKKCPHFNHWLAKFENLSA